jgi:Domain of unknown function in PX-proteins (DUF3818)
MPCNRLASTIYQLFVGSDNSSEVFSQLKRVHGLMPYFMIRGVLRISNPVAMIRNLLDLFLARPFGQTSLIQRMFSSGLSEEVKELKSDMEMVGQKIDSPIMVQKVKSFVSAPKEIQRVFRADAGRPPSRVRHRLWLIDISLVRHAEAEKVDIMTVILCTAEEPRLDRDSVERVRRANLAYTEYVSGRHAFEDSEDEGPDNDDAWLFEDLHVLMRMATRLRDKEQMIELIFEASSS